MTSWIRLLIQSVTLQAVLSLKLDMNQGQTFIGENINLTITDLHGPTMCIIDLTYRDENPSSASLDSDRDF